MFYGTVPAKENCTSYYIHFIALQYFPRTLEQEIKERSQRQQNFNEGEIWYIIEALNSVVASYLTRGNTHGDLQPRNMMIDSTGCIKVIDNRLFSHLNEKSMYVRYFSATSPAYGSRVSQIK